MGALILKQRTFEAIAEREPVHNPLQQAVDEAEEHIAEGHAVEDDEMREKLRRWAGGED